MEEGRQTLLGRCRRARGGRGRPAATRGELRRRMAATRRARSDAVGHVRVNGHSAQEQGSGTEQARPACVAGPKARRKAHLNEKMFFFKSLFKSFFIQMKF